MAYTATITKGSVTKSHYYYNVSLEVVVNDGVEDILTFSVTERYHPNEAPSVVVGKLQLSIKDKWDKYAEEQVVRNAAALDTAITSLNTLMNTYINN